MVRFVASAPGDQNAETVRQFRELQTALADLENRIVNELVLGWIVPTFVFSAHGMMLNASPVLGPDIGTGWQRVTAFDTVRGVRSIGFDTGADTWTYEHSGVYLVTIGLTLTHGESNQGRSFDIRLNNGVDVPGDGVPVPIARNQPGTSVTITMLETVPADDPNRTWFIEVGNGDAVTGVFWDAITLSVVNVGSWTDPLPDGVHVDHARGHWVEDMRGRWAP